MAALAVTFYNGTVVGDSDSDKWIEFAVRFNGVHLMCGRHVPPFQKCSTVNTGRAATRMVATSNAAMKGQIVRIAWSGSTRPMAQA
jgi:hypothetical protein